jgi:DnaJ like chaperone protein
MRRVVKWIGAGLGWTIGGPIGALLGFAFGTLIDSSDLEKQENKNKPTTKGDFIVSLLIIIAAIMKADQKVLRSELTFVKTYLRNAFGEEESGEMLIILRDLLKQNIPLTDVIKQISEKMDYPSRLQLMHLIFGIAEADGFIAHSELIQLDIIAGNLGITAGDISSLKNLFIKTTDWAYSVIGVNRTSTNEEIKQAFRMLAKKNHPDKVAYLGEEVLLKAQEKFQKINEAFEVIRKERGF